jgi:hypothetical protein
LKLWLNLNELNADEDKIQELETKPVTALAVLWSRSHIGDVAQDIFSRQEGTWLCIHFLSALLRQSSFGADYEKPTLALSPADPALLMQYARNENVQRTVRDSYPEGTLLQSGKRCA